MKKLLLLFIFSLLVFVGNAQIQAQMWKGAGITHTKVPPTFTPAVTNSWVAIDSSTGYWWNWDKDCPCWREMGSSLQFTGTTGSPSYTPDQGLSRFALNSGDSLYAYQLGSWRHLNDLPNLAGYLQWSDTFNIATQYFVLSQGFLLAEVDGDITNELQLLSISNDTIYLTSGGFVVLPPAVDTSGYNSSLTFANDTLWLTDDNSTLFAPIPLQEGLDSLRADLIDSLAAIDLTPYVQYSDSNTVFVTPSQLGDSLENYVQYGDSLTVFITPDQLSDSLAALPDSIVSGYGVAGYLSQYTSATGLDTTGIIWTSTGRMGVGQASPTARFQVTSTSTTSSTTALLVENSAGTDALQILDNGWTGFNTTPTTGVDILLSNPSYQNFNVRNSSGNILNTRHDGLIRLGSAGAQFGPTNSIFNNYLVDLGTFGFMCPSNWSTGGNNIGYWFYDRGAAATSGNLVDFKIGGIGATGFNPTSGTATYTELEVRPRYNQTGTASGYVAGIDYNPITTAILGAHYGLLIRSGRSGFGQATPTARTHITGEGTTSSTTALLVENSAGTDALSVTDDGATHVNGNLGITQGYFIRQDGASAGGWRFNVNDIVFYNQSNNAIGIIKSSAAGGGGAFAWGTTTPDASALMTLNATYAGFLPPRMTTAQRNAISSPATGLQVYNTTDSVMQHYTGIGWTSEKNIVQDLTGYVEWADTLTFISTRQDLIDTAAAIRADFPVGTTDLTIGGSGPTYTIESSTGADVTISSGSGITLSEGTPNVLSVATTLTLDAGTYVPTLTNTTNISSSTAHGFQYMRVGSTVTVSGQVTVAATAANTTTILELTIPVASALINDHELAGTGCGITTNNRVMAVQAQTTNDRAYVSWQPAATGDIIYSIHFTYQIL